MLAGVGGRRKRRKRKKRTRRRGEKRSEIDMEKIQTSGFSHH